MVVLGWLVVTGTIVAMVEVGAPAEAVVVTSRGVKIAKLTGPAQTGPTRLEILGYFWVKSWSSMGKGFR